MVAEPEHFARIPEAVLYDGRLSSNAVRVYGALARHANDETGDCWPSQARIGGLVHLKRTATSDALGELVDAGHIERVRRGRTLTNSYRVMFAIAESPEVMTARAESDDRQGGKVMTARAERNESHRNESHRNDSRRDSSSQQLALSANGDRPQAGDTTPADPVVERLCHTLADAIAERGSKRPTVSNAWRTDMDRLVRLDHRTPDEIEWVIRWLNSGTDGVAAFWSPNIRSPAKLRGRWDQMREQYDRLNRTDRYARDLDAIRRAAAKAAGS